jgi:protein O-mannosyl-transferase
MTAEPPRESRALCATLAPVLLLAAGLFAYHNSFHGPFVFDDVFAIEDNASIRQLWRALSPPDDTPLTGRPVANFSLAVNYALNGLDVRGYHVFNVAVHLAVALLFFGVVRRTLVSPPLRDRYAVPATGLALAAALLWVVHPLTTDAVTYVTQRTEAMMGFSLLMTLYASQRAFASSFAGGWYVTAALAFALGMGCKETIAVAPILVLAYDTLFVSASLRDALRRHAVLYVALAGTLVLLLVLLGARFQRDLPQVASDPAHAWRYALTQLGVIAHYLRLAVWPSPLATDYDDWPLARTFVDVLPAAMLVFTLVVATTWGLARRFRLAFLGLVVFAVLAPTSSLLPVPNEIAAERRMYVPLLAIVVAAVLAGDAMLATLVRRDRTRRLAAVLIVGAWGLGLALTTTRRNEVFRTVPSFWQDVLATRPRAVRARINLGKYLNERGSSAEASVLLEEAVRLRPDDPQTHYGLGVTLAAQGRLDEAITHYREALRLRPRDASTYNNLGNALARQGHFDDAVVQYREAIALDPAHARAHRNLGHALALSGHLKEAIWYYDESLRLHPEAETHVDLAGVLVRAGDMAAARQHLERALALEPRLEPARRALGDLPAQDE